MYNGSHTVNERENVDCGWSIQIRHILNLIGWLLCPHGSEHNNQSDSMFKYSREATRKKGGCRPGNWIGNLMVNGLGKKMPTTIQPKGY